MVLNCSHHYCSYCGKHKGSSLDQYTCNGTCEEHPDKEWNIKSLVDRQLLMDDSWLPIDQAPEEDGFEAQVLVNGVSMLGRYDCGNTWGWADDRGNWIYPTHFKPGESR